MTNDTKVYWQYGPLKGWLKPWKITLVADDNTGLSFQEIKAVIEHCQEYRLLTVEIALDFDHSFGVNRRFIRRHALFGKSRRRE